MTVEILKGIVRFQCHDGIWNFNAYQFGLAYGLLLALAVIEGEDPKPFDPPDEWLEDTLETVPQDIVHYDTIEGKWHLFIGNKAIRSLTDSEIAEIEDKDSDQATPSQAIRNFNRAVQAIGPILREDA